MNLNEYTTSDLNEAAILRYFGNVIDFVDKTQRRAQFCFICNDEILKTLDGYKKRTLLVEPYAFFQCIKEVKDRLYND